MREFLRKTLKEAAVDKIEIDRGRNQVTVTIHSGKPGFVIGRAGAGIEELKKKLVTKFFADKMTKLQLNITPTSGADMQQIVRDAYALPDAIVQKVRKALSE